MNSFLFVTRSGFTLPWIAHPTTYFFSCYIFMHVSLLMTDHSIIFMMMMITIIIIMMIITFTLEFVFHHAMQIKFSCYTAILV